MARHFVISLFKVMNMSKPALVILIVVVAALIVTLGSSLLGGRSFFGGIGLPRLSKAESLWVSHDIGAAWEEVAPARGINSLASLFAYTTTTPLAEEPIFLVGTRNQGLFLSANPVLPEESPQEGARSFAAVLLPPALTPQMSVYAIDQSRQHPREFFLALFEDNHGKIVKWVKPEAGKQGLGISYELYVTSLARYGMFGVRVDPANDRRIWTGGGDGLLVESQNGGASWTTRARFHEGIQKIVGHPLLASRMWILGSRGMFITTTNGGSTWTRLNGGLSKAKAGDIHELFYDSANAQLLAGTDRGILRSRDNGLNWELLPLTIPPSALPVRGIAVHPRNPATLIVSAHNLVYKSNDGGISWERNVLPADQTIERLLFSPKPPYPLYALTL